MKKFVKMSLVAAVAVAGLTTTSGAVDLTEAIKNVDLSGYARYRWTNSEDKKAASGVGATSTDKYKLYAGIKVPVNDNVKAQLGFLASGSDVSESDANKEVSVKQMNFTFTSSVATVIAGKQSIGIPVTDAADNVGTGMVALVPAGPATLVAAHFTSSNLAPAGVSYKSAAVSVGAIIASLGPVNVEAWVINGANGKTFNKGIEANYFEISGKVADMVTLTVKHATLDTDKVATVGEQEATTFLAAGKAGPVSLVAGYHTTGKDGGLVAFDSDAKSTFTVEQLSTNAGSACDAEAYYLSASMPIGPVVATIEFADGNLKSSSTESAKKIDVTETVVALAYSMSKNFKISGYISSYKVSTSGVDSETEKSRIEVKYTF